MGLNKPELSLEPRRWKVDKWLEKKQQNRTHWSTRYCDSPHEAIRVMHFHHDRGIKCRLSGKIYHYPLYDKPYYTHSNKIHFNELEEKLLEKEETFGYPREFWEKTLREVKIELGKLPPEGEILPRWRVKYGKDTDHEYFSDERIAITRYMTVKNRENPMLQAQVINGESDFIPADGNGINWLLSRSETLGKPLEYWKDLIEDIEKESTFTATEIDLKPVEDINGLYFRLSDVSKDFEIELSDELVLALDKLNRPYRYYPGWKTINRIWPAKHMLTKRLWDDYGRFRRRGKVYDRGAFITLDMAEEILGSTTLTRNQLEQHIIGIRVGTSNIGNEIELSMIVAIMVPSGSMV